MDVCKLEPPGTVAQQKAAQTEDTQRPPLVPSEKNNAAPATRKLRTREITSRYKSGISSTPTTPRRSPSPSAGRPHAMPGTSLPKRSQSADRRRPTTPSSRSSAPSSPSFKPSTPSSPSSRSTTPVRDAVTEMHNTSRRLLGSRAPDGFWPSMRSLSTSFQSESISVSVTKRDKVVTGSSSDRTLKSPANIAAERKRTPLRGRNTSEQSENYKPLENLHARVIDQHRWPAMMGGKVSANAVSRSVDHTDNINKSISSSIPYRGVSPRRMPASDGAGRGLQHSLSEVARRLAPDGSRKVQQNMSLSVNVSSHPSGRSSSATRPSRTQSSPSPGLHRPSSPNKALSTTLTRGMLSPSRSRPSTPGMLSPSRSRPSSPMSSSSSTISQAGMTSSIFNYIVDMRKGKKNASHIEDAHQLRLLYNRDLQWHFVNTRADDTISIQKMRTENILYSVWNTASKLRDSVIMKRIDVQQLRQELKLAMILREQMAYLENWAAYEREHCCSLSGAIEALKASTLRLPVTGGARADVLSVRNAVSSAVDVMQAMGSSICYLLSKVEGTKALVSELSAVAAKERAMLDECRELLASAAAMQVQEASLRTHLMQLRQHACKLE
ncbi:AUGMIN subunit 8 [Phoenix dactylifera]|uniref:AUGMIN subunit 8 n=1 Tax=Phoenix dactylifera TaxID=42345 RepID=A0A8B8ZVN2_PHODC|nr:AUGMIN subunit 8 [Phoenix dactylifera]XP_008790153.2 AUGMIN subunit 8 [Phoenix dactylifera]XP_038975444.1 AUGMIN subunit 8 [Phoenix dactylifera]